MQRRIMILVIVLLSAYSGAAHAYIDPGSGSFMLQILMATLLAVGFTIKGYLMSIKRVWKKIIGLSGAAGRTQEAKKVRDNESAK